ncbi:MAG: hypothetical protein L3J54_10830 [Draconibacterium sp.]|nr:hypothetical protein [Draconibacterium sp.]
MPTSKLKIIFKISIDEKEVLSSKMDVPLPGAKDIQVSKTDKITKSNRLQTPFPYIEKEVEYLNPES